MSVAFHRGLTHEFRLKMQMAGIKVEENDAQRALAGLLTREIDARGNPVKSNDNKHAIRSGAAGIVERTVEEVLNNRFELMKQWENDHPDTNPFPQSFPEIVIELLEYAEEESLPDLQVEILELARGELLFG